jgi:hypothetical protein
MKMPNHPASPDWPTCSPMAVAGRRYTGMLRFLIGGASYWRFLWREHVEEIRESDTPD